MSASLYAGKYAGIKVQIHWTFWLLFVFIGFMVYSQGGSTAELLWHSLFIIAIFICVVLHEFGHALTARRYGIGTRNITLLPIGGVASLKNIPENPLVEFLIAIAGPVVNVVIALILYAIIPVESYFQMDAETLEAELSTIHSGNFLFYLFLANSALVLFNIIPAFPMDGGRVFRSLLAMRMSRVEATRIATGLGKFIALVFFLFGLFNSIILTIIAVFVWFGAHSENITIRQLDLMQGYTVKDAMITEFSTLSPDSTLQDAIDRIIATTEQDFLVLENSEVSGILFMSDLANAVKQHDKNTPVDRIMETDFVSLQASDELSSAYRKLKRGDKNFFPVIEQNSVVGVLDINNINEFLRFRSAFDY